MIDDLAVVRVEGDFDVRTRATVRERFKPLAAARRAVIDLSEAGYIDSAGITELLLTHNARREGGGDAIRLVIPAGSNVMRVIELSGLAHVFVVVDSPARALEA